MQREQEVSSTTEGLLAELVSASQPEGHWIWVSLDPKETPENMECTQYVSDCELPFSKGELTFGLALRECIVAEARMY